MSKVCPTVMTLFYEYELLYRTQAASATRNSSRIHMQCVQACSRPSFSHRFVRVEGFVARNRLRDRLRAFGW